MRALPMMTSVVQARTAARYAVRLRGDEDTVPTIRIHVDRIRCLQTQMASLARPCSRQHEHGPPERPSEASPILVIRVGNSGRYPCSTDEEKGVTHPLAARFKPKLGQSGRE